jgi:hypothetical protein
MCFFPCHSPVQLSHPPTHTHPLPHTHGETSAHASHHAEDVDGSSHATIGVTPQPFTPLHQRASCAWLARDKVNFHSHPLAPRHLIPLEIGKLQLFASQKHLHEIRPLKHRHPAEASPLLGPAPLPPPTHHKQPRRKWCTHKTGVKSKRKTGNLFFCNFALFFQWFSC